MCVCALVRVCVCVFACLCMCAYVRFSFVFVCVRACVCERESEHICIRGSICHLSLTAKATCNRHQGKSACVWWVIFLRMNWYQRKEEHTIERSTIMKPTYTSRNRAVCVRGQKKGVSGQKRVASSRSEFSVNLYGVMAAAGVCSRARRTISNFGSPKVAKNNPGNVARDGASLDGF